MCSGRKKKDWGYELRMKNVELRMSMQRIRESLALILIALLPFHALAVTLLTKLIAGPGHAPLTASGSSTISFRSLRSLSCAVFSGPMHSGRR
jgi:hypothetical protein